MSICRPKDEIIVTDAVYAPTRMITSKLLKEFNVKTHFYNPESLESLQSKINKKTKMIFVENPGSNTFEFQDLSKIIKIAKKRKIITAIDNTWGTPFFIKPLKIGFDMSISSATKYLSGHSDVMLGSLAVRPKVNNVDREVEVASIDQKRKKEEGKDEEGGEPGTYTSTGTTLSQPRTTE